MRKDLKESILEGRETFFSERPLKRDITFDKHLVQELNKIVCISGVRRSGKSMYLRQLVDSMGYDKEDILFIDFSESSLEDFKSSDFESLPLAFLELFPNRSPVFLLDEIQEVGDFERGLRYLQNKGYPVCITGSSAHFFSRDIASRLRGKSFELNIHPLSFNEFLRFKQFEVKPAYTLPEKARLSSLTAEYLRWGGFPEVVIMKSPETKKHLLKGYLDTMLLWDVIEKNNIQNVPLMEQILSRAIRSFTKNISVHKWYNDFRSMGLKASKDTLYLYLGYLMESGFIRSIGEYGKSEGVGRKLYLIDNGLYEVRRNQGPDFGKLLENGVFLKLLFEGYGISYYQDGTTELDFIAGKQLVQVCHTLTDENSKRERSGFDRFEKHHPSNWERALVVQEQSVPGPEGTIDFPGFAGSPSI
jgi:uncharacterized protein